MDKDKLFYEIRQDVLNILDEHIKNGFDSTKYKPERYELVLKKMEKFMPGFLMNVFDYAATAFGYLTNEKEDFTFLVQQLMGIAAHLSHVREKIDRRIV